MPSVSSASSRVSSAPSSGQAPRRTFAIISHPDAGKTTLTEKFLLYAGAIETAGAVRARGGRQREVTSDWMDLERTRGISITSTAVQFEHGGVVMNLLDTPGHRDFSEDTYRVLSAVDSVVIVLDAARGIQSQTRKLFEVARDRRLPLLTFVNKCDRPSLPPLALLDDIEATLGLDATPITWPVGSGPTFEGVVDRRSGHLWEFERTPHGGSIGDELSTPIRRRDDDQEHRSTAWDELDLLSAVEADHALDGFLAGTATPVFFGSALWNFGVRLLLDAVVDLAPAPSAWQSVDGGEVRLDEQVTGQVFKVQANLDPRHRDRVAFVRIASGVFRRGMSLVNQRTGRTLTTRFAHSVFGRDRETVDEAVPGDVVALVNATDLLIGDTLSEDGRVEFPGLPAFAPELFATARAAETSRSKQFRRGIEQLDEEGVVQVLRTPDAGDREPILAAVGQMQFEVAAHRMAGEFGAEIVLEPLSFTVARRTDRDGAERLANRTGVLVAGRRDGSLVALFATEHRLAAARRDHPDLVLDRIGSS